MSMTQWEMSFNESAKNFSRAMSSFKRLYFEEAITFIDVSIKYANTDLETEVAEEFKALIEKRYKQLEPSIKAKEMRALANGE